VSASGLGDGDGDGDGFGLGEGLTGGAIDGTADGAVLGDAAPTGDATAPVVVGWPMIPASPARPTAVAHTPRTRSPIAATRPDVTRTR
jgi:hypothetical protein